MVDMSCRAKNHMFHDLSPKRFPLDDNKKALSLSTLIIITLQFRHLTLDIRHQTFLIYEINSIFHSFLKFFRIYQEFKFHCSCRRCQSFIFVSSPAISTLQSDVCPQRQRLRGVRSIVLLSKLHIFTLFPPLNKVRLRFYFFQP
jgi:hypothetical protein